MPSLTVKAFAELIHTPLYGQLRILNEQKHLNQAPGFFKIQYYRPALTVIRRYFQNGNNPAHLPTNGTAIPGVGTTDHRIENNLRALTAFRNGSQRNRTLAIHEPQTWELTLANVTVRATPLRIDLVFKRDDSSICHPRHLQTQFVALLFERGFDFINDDNSPRRCIVRIDGGCSERLQEYRQLPGYKPPS